MVKRTLYLNIVWIIHDWFVIKSIFMINKMEFSVTIVISGFIGNILDLIMLVKSNIIS